MLYTYLCILRYVVANVSPAPSVNHFPQCSGMILRSNQSARYMRIPSPRDWWKYQICYFHCLLNIQSRLFVQSLENIARENIKTLRKGLTAYRGGITASYILSGGDDSKPEKSNSKLSISSNFAEDVLCTAFLQLRLCFVEVRAAYIFQEYLTFRSMCVGTESLQD